MEEHTNRGRPRWFRRPAVVVSALVLSTVCAAVALYLFQPWKLWVDDVVSDPPPAGVVGPADDGRELPPSGPEVVASGWFVFDDGRHLDLGA